jgi:hypothetical protein
VCRQYGISHSHFLGGPPVWTDDDQDKAIAYEALLRVTCSSCGTRDEEWKEDPVAYLGHLWRCPGCETLELEKKNVPEEGAEGIHVGLIPRAVAEEME